MKVNTGKSHLVLSGNSRATATINNSHIESEDEQVLLVVTLDSNLTFENHINSICKEAIQKLNALARITLLHEYTEAKNNHEVFCNFSI